MNVAQRVTLAGTRPLLLRCLGRFRLEDASGAPLRLRTRKTRALLAALALSRRPMPRDALADLLWSDRGPAQARGSLRQSIFELQHVGGEAGFLVVGRDDLSLRRELLVTDIEMIRAAAEASDWPRLVQLLEGSEAGFLIDLDGLDGEFDTWLRIERTNEPAKAITAALAAAERCSCEGDLRTATEIITELLRLDPANEAVTRTAIRIDHALGDRSALRRHYAALCEQLMDDFGAQPSFESTELFERLSRSDADRAYSASQRKPLLADMGTKGRTRIRGIALVSASIAAILFAIAVLIYLGRQSLPADAKRPVVVAVLPFEEQGPGQAYLAEGLWDDTRSALARNSALRLLGRATLAAAARNRLSPDQYRRRFGADYLLDGAVRLSGNEVRVSVSLTRTSDGLAIWEDSFASRLGDPFALQLAIANGIEGKLRGRLAPGGGRLPDQIATSPEVYALYSEARPLIRSREEIQARRAKALLQRAVTLDPNFAPAWSSLAAAIYFSSWNPAGTTANDREALAAVHRALSLAPNLAEANATLALIEGEDSPDSERALRRAVALDPSYAEAWNWLGNALSSKWRYDEALEDYSRAVELDPLWYPPAQNLVATAHEIGNRTAVRRLLLELSRAGAPNEIVLPVHAQDTMLAGDYSQAVKLLAPLGTDASGKPPPAARSSWFEVLARLGYPERAARMIGYPDWYGPVISGQRLPPTAVQGKPITASDFWDNSFFPLFAARTMVNLGRAQDLVRLYRAAFRNADDFISGIGRSDDFVFIAPTVAAALRSSGSAAEADYVLAAASSRAELAIRAAPQSPEAPARLAYVRAAEGDKDQALRLLSVAIARGWLPDGVRQALDFEREPAFSGLRGDPRYEVLRRRVLDHVAKERAELGPLKF